MSNKIVVVFARKYKDYHSVKVYYDGSLVNKDIGEATEVIYGYGNQWEYSALELLYRHGIYREFKNRPQVLRRVVEEQNNDTLIKDCVEVTSKKALKFM